MMLNIVRSRYQEMPVFLAVSSVVSQFEYSTSGSGGLFGERVDASGVPKVDTISGDLRLNLGYAEFPTITYTPITGQEFARRLYSAVPHYLFFAAAHEGWATDIFMRIGVQRIGKAENMSFGEVRVIKNIPNELKKLERFFRVVESLFILFDGEVIEVREVKGGIESGADFEVEKGARKDADKKPSQYLVIAEEVPEDLRPVLAEFRQLVGIPKGKRFRITRRTTDIKDDEISVQARSVMAMIKFMGRGVEIPLEHLEQGRVIDYGLHAREAEVAKKFFPFRMRSSRTLPENASAAVRYKDYWFYIERDDVTSKRALEHLMILFQLKAPAGKGAAPLLTLPTR